MFNGMMDPDLIRMAQEQMSRMSPADMARIQQQMMSDPELMRMASESSAEVAAMCAYAEMLKNQGNVLHSQGKFVNALQKYKLAKENIKEIPSFQSRKLLLALSLNLMSCYLKTRQYEECIKEGSEVLVYDAKNPKALYRRGQAYKELGQLHEAVSDLSNAAEVSSGNKTIADLLRDTKEQLIKEGANSKKNKKKNKKKKLIKEGGDCAPRKLVNEEITEEDENVPSGNNRSSSSEQKVDQPKKFRDSSKSKSIANNGNPKSTSESLDTLKKELEAIRSFQNFISNVDPATLASLNNGQDVSPDMIKASSEMIEELQKVLDMASSLEGVNPFFGGGSSNSPFNPESSPPNVTPDMFKTASDMMSKMPPDELKETFEMASLLKGKESNPSSAAVDKNERNVSQSNFPSSSTTRAFGEPSPSNNAFSNIRNASEPNFPSSSIDLQEQMRNQMVDPSMRQMFTSMVKNMSPEVMANMGEQFGFKLSPEAAAKALQAMSFLLENLDKMMFTSMVKNMSPEVMANMGEQFGFKLSPEAAAKALQAMSFLLENLDKMVSSFPKAMSFLLENLDKMMLWADRLQRGAECVQRGAECVQRGVECVKRTKNWLLGRSGLVFAICMLILAFILHRSGFIGS